VMDPEFKGINTGMSRPSPDRPARVRTCRWAQRNAAPRIHARRQRPLQVRVGGPDGRTPAAAR
jgi:hypothetical protein